MSHKAGRLAMAFLAPLSVLSAVAAAALTQTPVPAAAATSFPSQVAAGSSLVAANPTTGPPILPASSSAGKASNWTLTLAAGSSWNPGDFITIAIADSTANFASSTVTFNSITSTASTIPVTVPPSVSGSSVTVTLCSTCHAGGQSISAPITITLGQIKYNTGAIDGAVNVEVSYTSRVQSSAVVNNANAYSDTTILNDCGAPASNLPNCPNFSMASASNAAVVSLAAPGSTLVAASQPEFAADGASHGAGNLTLTLAAGSQWTADEKVNIAVEDSGGSTSTVTCSAVGPVTDTTRSLTLSAICLSNPNADVVQVDLGAAQSQTSAPDVISITGIKYTVGVSAAHGQVELVANLGGVPSTSNTVPTAFQIATTSSAGNASNMMIVSGLGSGSSLVANSVTHISSSPVDQAAGSWTLTLGKGTNWSTGDEIQITLNDAYNQQITTNSTTLSTLWFATVPSVSASSPSNDTALSPSPSISNNVLTIELLGQGQSNTPASQKLTISAVAYSCYGAPSSTCSSPLAVADGNVTVTATFSGGTSSPYSGGYAPNLDTTNAANAAVEGTPSVTLSASSTPQIAEGASSQPGGNWTLVLGATGSASGWASGDTIDVPVADNSGKNCQAGSGGDTVVFSSVPLVSVSASSGVSTTPTVTAKIQADGVANSTSPNCAAGNGNDELVVSFTDSGTFSTGGSVTVAIANVAYSSSGTFSCTPGTGCNLKVGDVLYDSAVAQKGSTSGASATPAGPSDATLSPLVVGTTPVAVAPSNTTPAAINAIVLTEAAAGTLPVGDTVTVSFDGGMGAFDSADKPAISVSGGGAAASTPTIAAGALSFTVTAASVGAAAAFTLSAMTVDAGAALGEVTLKVVDSNATTYSDGIVRAFDVIGGTRISGTDAEATAVATMKAAFTCASVSGNVVLASDAEPWDSLSASFLAGHLGTGILLTPPATLSSGTAAALKYFGVSNVYVVGGNLAVSDAVVNAIDATPVTDCSGNTGSTNIKVSRIQGATLYDTSQQIAQWFVDASLASGVRSAAFPSAYGNYNDTTGGSSASGPATALPTAIVATGYDFHDATAASAMASNSNQTPVTGLGTAGTQFPLILTDAVNLSSQAQSALTNLGIQQVIVMGGPLAVSDNVVGQIEKIGSGISVLRIAGSDYTDTAQLLAQFELSASGLDWQSTAGFANTIEVAQGSGYADAITGSALAGSRSEPLLLTYDPLTVGAFLGSFLNEAGNWPTPLVAPPHGVETINVLGGLLALTNGTVTTMDNDLAAG